ncbi:MAG: lipoprotein insertase outer membrane protein LolB [Pseudoxanthomonas sp.]
MKSMLMKSKSMKSKLILLAVLLLSACATQTKKPVPPPVDADVAEQGQLAREAALRQQPQWSLSGRVALSRGNSGGSGRIEWRQDGDSAQVSLSAPITRQSWQLSTGAEGARLEGLEGGARTGVDAASLLREATGWEIPVTALSDWLRGLRAPNPAPEAVIYDAQGRLSQLRQGGWIIDYRWPAATAATPELPTRIDAAKGDAKVKLLVDAWAQP